MPDKRILIIAGPNGAGKTTFALEFLPNEADCPIFVNADEIAEAFSPGNPDAAAVAAGREMLRQIDELVARGKTFAFETTLSGLAYAKRIPIWQAAGYHVKLLFLRLSSPKLAIQRVAERVALGGHSIPEPDIRRRFGRGLENFETAYRRVVDSWVLYDCDGYPPIPIDWSP